MVNADWPVVWLLPGTSSPRWVAIQQTDTPAATRSESAASCQVRKPPTDKPIAPTRAGSTPGRPAVNSAARRSSCAIRPAHEDPRKQVRGEGLLVVVTATATVGPVQHVGGDADVTPPGKFIADEASTVIASHPFTGGVDALGGVVPRLDDLLLADVKAGPVIVQQQHGRMRPGRLRGENKGENPAVGGELETDLAGHVGAAVLFRDQTRGKGRTGWSRLQAFEHPGPGVGAPLIEVGGSVQAPTREGPSSRAARRSCPMGRRSRTPAASQS